MEHNYQKHLYAIIASDKSQITVLACPYATGYTIPPMVVFDRKHLHPDMTAGKVPGTYNGLSEKGGMDGQLFQEYFQSEPFPSYQ